MRSPIFDAGMTIVRVGPADVRPKPADGAVACYKCGGWTWAADRTYDWKQGNTRIRNALTLRCVRCGYHRSPGTRNA